MTDISPLEPLLTPREVATILRVEISTVRSWTRTGRLPLVRLGPRVPRYRQSDIEALMEPVQHDTAA